MSRGLDVRRSLALTSVLVVATWGVAAMPASADPTSGRSDGHSRAGTHQANGHASPHAVEAKHAKDAKHGHATKGQGGTKEHAGAAEHGHHGDPAGNNGTVKIAPLGEMDGIPNNSPHPGCDFQIEWYGFDEGADIISTVTFAMQAPTKDAGLTVAGPSTVFVGGDPASGAGTATGLDGTQAYSLSFDGAPHPKQGYHVKLTVATPRSKGNDTKTKVFWVAPCETPSTVAGSESGDDTTAAEGDDDTTTSSLGGRQTDAGADQAQAQGALATAGDNSELGAAQAGSEDTTRPPSTPVRTAGPRRTGSAPRCPCSSSRWAPPWPQWPS